MKPYRLGNLFALLTLSVLFLTACQPAGLETANPPAEPVVTATQPVEVKTEAPASEPTETAVTMETAAPEGWQVLNESDQGYSLSYPAEWEVCQETKYSWTFCDSQADPAWMGPPLRLYVSVFPKDYTNSDYEVYNFYPIETIQEFMALPVGETKLKEAEATPPEYFTYTRLPDRRVAGQSALVIENPKVWEAPPGTKDRVVFILTEDTTYLLGMYYETPEQLAMFEQVFDSFQIVP